MIPITRGPALLAHYPPPRRDCRTRRTRRYGMRPADPGTHLPEYSDDGKVIQRKLQINVGDAQVGQKLDRQREVVEIERYGGKPQHADNRETLPADFMPPDNGSFGEPV